MLRKSAVLDHLVQQVQLINSMEEVLFSPFFPPSIMAKLKQRRAKSKPDSSSWNDTVLNIQKFKSLVFKLNGLQRHIDGVFTIRPFDPNDLRLTEALKRSLYDNCVKRQARNREEEETRRMKEQAEGIIEVRETMERILVLLGEKRRRKYGRTDSRDSCDGQIARHLSVAGRLQVDEDIESDSDVANYETYVSWTNINNTENTENTGNSPLTGSGEEEQADRLDRGQREDKNFGI